MHARNNLVLLAQYQISKNILENLNCWVKSTDLVEWAKAHLDIDKPNSLMTNDDIRRSIRWIGDNSIDTVRVYDRSTHLSRIGIDNMLLVTLIVFPEYYMKYELAMLN